ncbi:hypothetical protein P0136_10830 [Lentisphaerota bacterium ZTH]|nr:hypothetical protein JYG24_11650 [Lentisphaerota bacterium]WET05856.1 hypothetical protein P0136_10830 [Lentisphaerota bacterium ZTH]
MGVAALVIGIVAVVFSFVPYLGFLAIAMAIVGFILGVVDVSCKSKAKLPTGNGIAGIVLNSVAIVASLIMCTLICAGICFHPQHLRELREQMMGPCPKEMKVPCPGRVCPDKPK